MSRRSSLEWVQINRAKRSRTERVSGLVERLARRFVAPAGEEAAAIVEILRLRVDSAFRSGCRVFVRADGVVSIQVERPGEVYVMRQQWFATVVEAVAVGVPRLAGRRILFEQGTAGVGFGA